MSLSLALRFSLIFSILFSGQSAIAAACCGGGFAAPSIIAGDDKAQLSTSHAVTNVVVDNVDSSGIWRKWDTHQQVQTFKVEGAHIFSDRFQAGFSLPIIQRARQNLNSSGLGDISASLGYEYLPDWNYNPIRPKGIGFFQLIIPTGKSRSDSEIGGLDSRGNGFWALGIGTLLTKSWSKIDANASLEVHRSFSKNISNTSFSGKLEPGFGGQLAMGVGYNFKAYRLGSNLNWTYEDAIKTKSNTGVINYGSIERYTTASVNLSYLFSTEWSGTFSYSDQTLFGSPINTSLGRGIALQVQRRWSR